MPCTSRPLLLLAALAAACAAERELPPPAPSSIEPSIAYNRYDVPVVIRGDAFYARASHAVDGSGAEVSTEFLAWLGTVALADVEWLDAGSLSAVVPAGIAAGTHALVVRGPYGTSGALPGAYSAVQGSALLKVTATPLPATALAGEAAEVLVRAENTGTVAVQTVHVHLRRADPPKTEIRGAPAPFDLAPGAFVDATFPFTTTAPGSFALEARADGIDPHTRAFVGSNRDAFALDVIADVRATAAVSPDPVLVGSTGARVEVTVTAVNWTPWAMTAHVDAARVNVVRVDGAGDPAIANPDAGVPAPLAPFGGSGTIVYSLDVLGPGDLLLALPVVASDGAAHSDEVLLPIPITALP